MKNLVSLLLLILFYACSNPKQYRVEEIVKMNVVRLEDGTLLTLIGVKAPTQAYIDALKQTKNNYVLLYDENYNPINELTGTTISAYIYDLDNNCINDLAEEGDIIHTVINGNQLPNGASPFEHYFGKGKYGGEAWILFKNGNETDAVVCLVDIYSQETIRNEYIRSGQEYKMSKVPDGTYYLKVYYGNDWNPDKQTLYGKGAFNYDEHYSKSDKMDDYIEIKNTATGYSTYTITLYSVIDGNMSSVPINEAEFFEHD
jgi:hypothetical protein